jgi:acetyltransferase-like isoleucine patch superfamily enzyme
LFKTYCGVFRPRVSIGRNFKLSGRLRIRGPGRVIIGDNVECGSVVTPWTYDPNAIIRIGDGVYLNGARFGCQKEIEIGDRCILSDCRIMDTDFHSVEPDHRNDPKWIKSAPIKIETNVWLAAGCIVLKGVTIGRNSTISPSSVVGSNIPSASVACGNPAKVLWRLDERYF